MSVKKPYTKRLDQEGLEEYAFRVEVRKMTRMWPKIPGFFDFLQPCSTTSEAEMAILESWRRWFEGRGIATRVEIRLGWAVLYRALENGRRPGYRVGERKQ